MPTAAATPTPWKRRSRHLWRICPSARSFRHRSPTRQESIKEVNEEDGKGSPEHYKKRLGEMGLLPASLPIALARLNKHDELANVPDTVMQADLLNVPERVIPACMKRVRASASASAPVRCAPDGTRRCLK